MPIVPPRLDDRSFNDLVEELLARVPAHTPEWTPQQGDPGRTLIELFAWLADTILYRANLIPERQRLAFLRLLGKPMQPARAAQGLLSVGFADPVFTGSVSIAPFAKVSGPVEFETRDELTVLPILSECYYKRPLSVQESEEMSEVLAELQTFHEITPDKIVQGYVTTPIFTNGEADTQGLDLVQDTTDRSLWVALIVQEQAQGQIEEIKDTLIGKNTGNQQILNLGVTPKIVVPETLEEFQLIGRIPHAWDISTNQFINDKPVYRSLTSIEDTSLDLTRQGVERLLLPAHEDNLGLLEGDVRKDSNAGVGDRPPRIDDPDKINRIVAWLRLRPTKAVTSMALSWVGINVVEIDQRRTIKDRVIGVSDGSAGQVLTLPANSVEPDSFKLQVDETDRGYVTWTRIDDLALADKDDSVYSFDSEAGTVEFGNGIYGHIPEQGRRIRVSMMRAGGGAGGNLPPASLNNISASKLEGGALEQPLEVIQALPTSGGADSETLAVAEQRIPGWLRHRNRCVTMSDYKSLVMETPGLQVGRVEVLPRFLPQQRRFGIPGAVTVMVLPFKDKQEAPNPRPDQPFIEKVYGYLDIKRPVATELYGIGCEYVPISTSVGVSVRKGFGYEEIRLNVVKEIKNYLWSLAPNGPQEEGWPLGKAVYDREIEVIVARVAGVKEVNGVNLFKLENKVWRLLPRTGCEPVGIELLEWQLPELLNVMVTLDGLPSEDFYATPDPYSGITGTTGDIEQTGVAVPVVPEVC